MTVAPEQPAGIEHVAVMPVKAPSDAARALFTYLVIRDLRQTGRYQLLEPGTIQEELDLPDLALAALTEAQAVEVGQLLGVDAVITGSVASFDTANAQSATPSLVAVEMRMLDCAWGKTLWTIALRVHAESMETKLSEHAEKVVQQAIAALETKLPPVNRGADVSKMAANPLPRVSLEVAVNEEDAVTLSEPLAGDTPEGFQASEVGLREVTLVWDRPQGPAESFRIERSQTARGEFAAVAGVSPRRRHYRDHDRPGSELKDGQTYYYRAVAVQRDGTESAPTKPVKVEMPPPPDPPSAIEARTPDSRLVILSWVPPASEGVVEYIVERAPAGEPGRFAQVLTVSATTGRDAGDEERPLQDDADYLYRVRSANRVGAVGEPSEALAVTTQPRPFAVSNLVAEDRGVRAVPLAWTLNAETNVVAYHIFRTDTENGEFELLKIIGGRTNTRYVDGGGIPGNLPDDRTFFYMVKAVNAVGAASDPSDVVAATTRGIPPVVRGLEAAPDQPRQVALQWEEAPDEKVEGYEIWRAVGQGDHFSAIGRTSRRESTTYVDRGGTRRADGLGLLLDGQTYRYKVIAFNTAQVRSEWSAIAAARTKKAPDVPAGLRSTTDLPRRVDLAWQANPETDVIEYLVEIRNQPAGGQRKVERVPALADTSLMSFTDAGLKDGEEQYYRVKVLDDDGLESEWCDVVPGLAKPAPDTPRNLNAHAEDRSVRLTWDAAPQDDIQEYRIWTKVMLSWELLDTTESTEYELPPAERAKRSVLCVSSVDQDGLESGRSAPVRSERVQTW